MATTYFTPGRAVLHRNDSDRCDGGRRVLWQSWQWEPPGSTSWCWGGKTCCQNKGKLAYICLRMLSMTTKQNKRTVAAVSSEDKRRALNAMEELRARGATTDDLMCRWESRWNSEKIKKWCRPAGEFSDDLSFLLSQAVRSSKTVHGILNLAHPL